MDDKDAVIQTPENTGAEINMALYKPVDYLQQYRNSHKDMVLTGDDVQRTYTYDPATWKPTQYEKLGFFGKVGAGVSNFVADSIDIPESIERYALGAGVGMKKTFFPNMKEHEFERLYNNLQTNYTSAQNNRWEYLNEATDGHTGVIEGTEAILNLLEFIGAGYIGAGAGAATATSPRAAKLLAKGKQIGKITQGRIARGAAKGAERAVGALATEQTGTQIAGEFAQQYAEQTGDTTFQNYNPGKDTLEATGLAVLSGIINTKLDVGRLAGGATSKFVSKATTTAGRAGRQLAQAGGQEFVEESIESVTQDVGRLLSDYDYELELDDIVKNAITNGLIGAALGGPAGAGIYYINRSRAIHWYTEKGLKQEQATQIVDEIMDTGRSELLEEINTSAELAMQQGQAFQSLYNAYLGMFNATATEEERFYPTQAETYAKDAPQWRIHNLAYTTATQQANIITTHIADNNMPTDLFIQMNEAMDNMLAMRNFTPEEVINRLTQIEQELAHQRELGEAKNPDVVAKMKRQKSVLMKVARINQNIEVNRTRYRLRQNAQIDQNTIQENAPQLVGTLEGIKQATKGQKFVYVGNTKVPVQYKVVDLKQVKQSHINGIANPEYTNKELQNRSSRSTQADVAVLRDRAKNLRPYELLESYNAQSGAPLTNTKGEVIAGNGRTETIRFAYETNPEAIAEYKQAIKDLGYDIEGMEQPILIRETDMTAEQQLAVADASNISQISAFDHASRAIQDSKLLPDTKDIMDFGNKIPLNERQGLFLNDNTWDMRALEQRYNDAILAWVCGNNANLFQDIVLSNKTPKKVVDAISRAGATAFQMNEAHPELQIQDDLLGALQKLRSVDKKERFVEVVNQTTIDGKNPFGENMFLYQFVFEDQDTIAGFIGEYARLAEIPTIGLFGEEPLSKYDLMNRAEQAIDAHKQQLAIAADRPYKSKFGENGETLDTNLLAVQMSNTNGNTTELAQRTTANAWYDPELQTIALGARWNEFSIPHEMAHHWLNSFFNIYKQAQQGKITITDAWKQDAERLFAFIGIDTRQSQVTTVQQEKWASMNEAYIAGFVPAELKNNIAYKDFQQWTPQKYKSIMQIGYLDENGNVINPVLTADDIEFFNKWYAHPDFGNIDIHPEGQKWAEPAQNTKAMNNREKTIAQDWQEIETGNQQLDTLRDENTPTELKSQVEAAEVRQKQNASEEVPTLPEHESFLKFGAKDAKARMAEIARNYIKENKEHAYEIAASNPLFTENDTGVDREFLIMAVIEDKGLKPSDPEYAQLMHNAARTRQIAGSTLGLHNESSFRWYIDAMTQIEETLENKAAINYAGRGRYARYKFNQDIEEFVAQRVDKILSTAKNSQERNTALSAMFAEATTKFGGNVNDGALTQLDLTGQTATRANKQAFVAWAKAEIKRRAGAGIKPEDQAKLLEVSQKAQQAEAELDSPDKATAIAAAKTLREWQNTVNGFKKTAKGKVGRFFDSVFGEYAPRAMLFSPSTLLANVPGNIINTAAVRIADKVYGASKVDKKAIANEIDRLKAISRSTGMNIATMDKPTSPSLLHGEKYKQTSEAWKWVDPFTYLGETDNLFRISTYTDVLARIATRDAEKQGVSPTELFRAYTKVHQEKGSAGEKARMEAIEIGNIAVFTQNGQLAKMANKIRDALNIVGTGTYGLGNLISPFVKTPANIIEMGARAIAMPFTHWGTILNWKNATTKAKFDFAIDGITLATATIATVLLAALSDDDWYEESYEGGKFDYNKPYDSIKIGGVWIRLDQFGTAMLPMQFGAKMVKELQSNSDWTDTLQKTVWHGFKEGIRQTPVIDTFQDNSLSWASRKPGQYALNWAYNQTNKLVPAWMKQIERPIMRETDIVVTPGTYIGKKFARNYGLDGTDNTINDWLGIIYGRIKVTK